MAPLRIVVIGGVACGPKAAARARRLDPEAEITVLEQGEHISYAACGIPYYIGGQTEHLEALLSTPVGIKRDPAFFRRVKAVNFLTRTRAESIDRKKKVVHAVNLETGEQLSLPYDRLVIATGARPARLPVPGTDLPNVHHIWTPDDAQVIRSKLATGKIGQVVIVGAGLIGLEVAESILRARGLPGGPPRVVVLEAMPHITPALLDPEIAALVTKHLNINRLQIRVNELVQRIEPAENGSMNVITPNGAVPADLVLVAIGARPNVTLAQEAGLEIGGTGAIKVNERMQTSDPDIYAGGDCVESTHLITAKPIYTPLGSVANKQGRVIGTNIVGGRETFPGVLATSIYKVFDYTVGRTGLTEKQAQDFGYQVETILVAGSDRAHFYPGHAAVHVKLVVDAPSRKLLGAQIVGPGEINKRLDVIVACLHMGATVDQLAYFDLAYAPPYNTSMDVLHHAANTLRNKLDGLARTIEVPEMKEMLERGEEVVFVDVRTNREFSDVPPIRDQVKFIPLAKIRELHERLPRDKTLVPYCTVSMRAWEAQRVLDGLGFKDVRFLEGGLSSWPY
ncbi:MAG: FAD-dependent oxidoreductase [Bacillota bacterium]|nr:FAD-dependent oxidoreductase [Bacillota bacterium]